MESTRTGWWQRHGWTVAILLTAFGSAFAIRTIWTYPVIAQWGPLFTYAGGSDSYYHSRVMAYIVLNHHNLIHDPLLRFPVGAINPREPLFDWMNAILGLLFAPFFSGNAVVAGAWFLDLQGPLWAALGVFPVYLIGKEVSNRRMGLIAALIFPFLSANIDSSIFGYANYLSFYTFIILVTVYSYLRTVKAVGNRRYVESYRDWRQYRPALREFWLKDRTTVKWAVFTGVSLGALALAWQGYTYAVVVIGLSVFIAMIAERIRRVDSFGLYVTTWIVGLVGFPMEFFYYFTQYGNSFLAYGFITFWIVPAVLFFGILLLLLPFLLLRDVPWVFSVPLLIGLVVAGTGALALLSPSTFTSIVTGQGYFVKTLIYSTVAEAQAPSIDQLILGYGVVTFFLGFVGLALFLYLLVRGRFKRVHVVFLVFAILSIYLPISASKFFLLGSPIFALLPAEAIRRALDVGSFPELRRTVASLSDRRSQLAAFRKAFKARHVLVFALVLLIILPNVWVSIDAGIPGNSKSQLAAQVGATLPPWLQLNTSNPSSYYFGAAGTSLDTPNQYDSAGYNWLAQQDANIPAPNRPAFVSWWDYGFQAIAQGNHPSVADNFQNGIDPAGQFLLTQNESQAIAVLATTLLQGEQTSSTLAYLPTSLNRILAADGLNLTELHTLLVNQSLDLPLVIAHPERYLPVNPSTLTADNAMYMAMSYFLATSLPLAGVAKVYDDIQSYTGHSIRYGMSDSRLFPFSGQSTGIFYAPADLTGRIIDSAGMPSTYFNVTILATNGNTYPAGHLPAGVGASSYNINYFAPFYNSMIYHTYIGYNGTEAGLGPGIPGLSLNATIEPAWMLQHFQVVYMTAYYCPSKAEAAVNPSCYVAMNKPQAEALAAAGNGSANTGATAYFQGGESFLEYYPGQTLLGEVQLPDGTPVAAARVTVDDSWGIPHMTTLTAADGSYSVVLPPGNDTVNVTIGTFNALSQQGNIVLKSLKLVVPNAIGLGFNAPNLVENVQIPASIVQGTVYWQTGNNTTFVSGEPLVSGGTVILWGPNGLSPIVATTDSSGTFQRKDVPAGVYNVSVLYAGHNYTEPVVYAQPGTPSNNTIALRSAKVRGTVFESLSPAPNVLVTATGTGTRMTNVTGAGGGFALEGFGPGNFTVVASVPGTDLRSAGAFVRITTPGESVTANLTLLPSVAVSVAAVANGAPAAGIPVRFLSIATFANRSASPLAELLAASQNGTVVTTTAGGVATAYLPIGSYSVYALGVVGSERYAGLTTLSASLGVPSSLVPLRLAPAVRVAGTVTTAGSAGNATPTAVLAYATDGSGAITWVSPNGSFTVWLPTGTYSLLALQGSLAPQSTIYAALESVPVTTSTTVSLLPSVAVTARFQVGTVLSAGRFFPAEAAAVNVSFGLTGASVPAFADSNGSVVFYVPSVLPVTASSYCVRVQSLGFGATSECGLTPNGLALLTELPLTLTPVAVLLQVTGLPSGTPVTVNLTAESPSAVNRTLVGGPTFSFSSPPGVYGVGARATIGNGTLVYLPAALLTTAIPVGASLTLLTLRLVPEVTAKGTLELPPNAKLANVTVSLSSPVVNLTVNGTAYTDGFYAATGEYSAYANVSVGGVQYTDLAPIIVASNGGIGTVLRLNATGVPVTGSLLRPSGLGFDTRSTVTLTSASGATILAPASAGKFTVVLPPNQTYAVNATVVSPVTGPNGTYSATWATVPGSACTTKAPSSPCSITLAPEPGLVWLNGTLTAFGVPGPLSGTVRLVGPYPYVNLTVISASNGSFATQVLPGAYSIYAAGGGTGDPLSNFSSLVVLSSVVGSPSLPLSPTWIDTITVTSSNGSIAIPGPATVAIRNAFGSSTVFTGITASAPFQVALPVGSYTVTASATGSPYGARAMASATAAVTVLHGNVGTMLPLAYQFNPTAAGTLVGPSSVTVPGGGLVTFSFTVRNSGNVPIVVHPVGTPSYWTFNFTLGNVSLLPGAGAAAASGEATLRIPLGTSVSHPPVGITFALADGAVVGAVTPTPLVTILGYYGVAVGHATLQPAQVGPSEVRVPFYVADTGNRPETVSVTVVDANRIEGMGWAVGLSTGGRTVLAPVYVEDGTNATWFVNLTATGSIFVPPGTVTIAATVLNASGALQASTVLAIPPGVVAPSTANGTAPITVTGPSIGVPPSSLPDWVIPILVFLPAVALVVAILLYRWNRTRRWTRR